MPHYRAQYLVVQHTHKTPPSERRAGVFIACRELFTGLDSLAGANACAGSAVDALVGIDNVDIAGRDSLYRTFVDAGSASDAGIIDFVSHCLKVFVNKVSAKIIKFFNSSTFGAYFIMSKPV